MSEAIEIPESVALLVDAVRRGEILLSSSEAEPLLRWLDEAPARQAWLQQELEFDRMMERSAALLPVPPGLADRLQSSVQALKSELLVSQGKAGASGDLSGSVSNRVRRVWGNATTQFGLGIATALAVVVATVLWWRAPTIDSSSKQLEAVIVKSADWFEELIEDPGWEANLGEALADYPLYQGLPRDVQRGRPYLGNWGSGFVYDLSRSNGLAAMLFVVRPSQPITAQQGLPHRPVYVDQNHAIGAGVQDGFVYILVVQGTDHEYLALFRATAAID